MLTPGRPDRHAGAGARDLRRSRRRRLRRPAGDRDPADVRGRARRPKRYVSYGASPRASIALVTGARALAFTRGRDYALPDDVSELALDVLRHRIVLSYEALADDVTADAIITRVLDAVPAPEVVLSGR